MSAILKLDHIAYSYYSDTGEVKVMDNMDFTIENGSFTAIVGPSGCGKSTILSLIAGLLKPTDGFITLYSNDFAAPKIGYMLQHDHLLEWRDIYHNVILGLEIQHKLTNESLALVDELLEKYNLSHTKALLPSELSGGMRQRIALIRTLTLKPDLLLLDEPFSALDYQTRLLVSQDVHRIIKSENKTAILVTHDIAEAISMADHVLLLSKAPCQVKLSIPIEFEKHGISRETVRDSKLFQDYFDLIWGELQNENTEK
ncbi:MAG: ABC transporter ATP-binding protein [Lachnospiraceae bacterium]|nr:ABC transporter ATP-binding protein [Lachnospiraceae bacterium]